MNSIEELANQLISEAVQAHASDIHIIPRSKDTIVQFRLGHQLISKYILPLGDCERLISHYKFTASMDIGERRRPQNGAYSISLGGQSFGLRLSTLPGNKKESLVIRILPQQQAIPFYQLSLFPQMNDQLLSFLHQANGLILLTGPTGSGKTTTLYTLLDVCSKNLARHVITLEDPVEKESDELLQVQVNEKAGITYAAGLKAILRHDPDVIMVGEIRDSETARTAVRAALTGHLVISTMHSRDTRGAIYRLLEFGVSIHEIEQTLVAVTAQRLVELGCPFCKGVCSPYCFTSNRPKRASVFEILSGTSLNGVLSEANGKPVPYHYRTLKQVISKGIALGFIKNYEYERWVLGS